MEDAAQIIPEVKDIVWPTMKTIRTSQGVYGNKPPGLVWSDAISQWTTKERIWIPEADLELQLKILVISHDGTIGHRGTDSTKSIVKKSFWCPTIDKDVKELVRGCLHCIITPQGDVVPRLLGKALHVPKPDEVLDVDYFYMCPKTGKEIPSPYPR